jgi:hypothetical protein
VIHLGRAERLGRLRECHELLGVESHLASV